MKTDLHPSSIGSFFECSYRWYRDNLFKPIRRIGIAAHLGTSIHKAAETYYSESIKEKQWAKVRDDYKCVAIDTFRERLKDDEPIDIKEVNLNDIEKSIATNSKNYLENSKKLNRDKLPIAVEKSYTVKINSPVIEQIHGTLDIVGDNYISDIKTMSKVKNPKSYILQQGVYAFMRQKAGEDVKDLYIHRVVVPKGYTDCVSIIDNLDNPFTPIDAIIERSKSYVEMIVKTVNEFHKTGNELLFRGNPESILCSPKYCAYYDECKYKKGF